jgi:hypothetical protein
LYKNWISKVKDNLNKERDAGKIFDYEKCYREAKPPVWNVKVPKVKEKTK